MTGEQLVAILGAYSFFVLGAFGMLIKFVLDTRRATTETNKAVNNRPDEQPTLRELVEELHGDMRDLRREGNRRHEQSTTRHQENVARLKGLDRRLETVEADLRTHMNQLDERE